MIQHCTKEELDKRLNNLSGGEASLSGLIVSKVCDLHLTYDQAKEAMDFANSELLYKLFEKKF